MEHEYIEQHQIVDRYVMGKLSPEEAERFEEHYLSCQACIDQVELAEQFQAGVRRAASEDVAMVSLTRQLGLMAWLSALGPWRRAATMSAMVLFVAVLLLPSGVLYHKLTTQQQDQAGRQLANSDEVARLRQEIAEARSELADREQRSQQELAAARANSAELSEELARVRQPQPNTPIFSLQPQRSGGQGEPAVLVRLSEAPEWIVLSFLLDLPQHDRYQVALLRDEGTVSWQGDGFQPSYLDTLVLTLHSSMLEAGDYQARVSGVSHTGKEIHVATFPFRVIREP